MVAIGKFNASEVNPEVGYSPVPPGDYMMVITNSEVLASKENPANSYLKLEHTIVEGDNKNRKITNILNLWHSNPTAVRIAEGHLSQLCRAVGKMVIENSVELHGVPFKAKVSVDAKGDKPQNRIDQYYYDKGTSTTAPQTVAGSGAAQAVASTTAPWQR